MDFKTLEQADRFNDLTDKKDLTTEEKKELKILNKTFRRINNEPKRTKTEA